jgi:hypothetical protein
MPFPGRVPPTVGRLEQARNWAIRPGCGAEGVEEVAPRKVTRRNQMSPSSISAFAFHGLLRSLNRSITR